MTEVGNPASVAEAQERLAFLLEWAADFRARQALVPEYNTEAAFLQGWLLHATAPAAEPDAPAPPNRAARRAKGPTKKAAAKKPPRR